MWIVGIIYEAIRKAEDEELSWETKDDDKFNSNGRIQKAIEKQGNIISKDVIAYWLKLAHENSI